ncbi:MAG: pilus assembly protein PilO [Flavobacteriales bacterium]|nr:pilus assembly protein PilO [Flavobacteriales bacterium]
MDLSELKNLDLNDLVAKLKKSEIFKDKKTLAKIGIFLGAFLLSIIIYYSLVSPILAQQRQQIAQMEQNILEINDLNMQIEDTLFQSSELKPKYFKNSVLFHSKEEVEDLYQSISNFALANGLSIVNIKKGEPKAIRGDLSMIADDNGNNDDSSENYDDGSGEEGGDILYYKIPVDYEIKGSFLGYLKFRRELSKSLKVINFDKEEVVALTQPQGQILSKGTISIVGLPNEYN